MHPIHAVPPGHLRKNEMRFDWLRDYSDGRFPKQRAEIKRRSRRAIRRITKSWLAQAES
jgi:hypothetical protein